MSSTTPTRSLRTKVLVLIAGIIAATLGLVAHSTSPAFAYNRYHATTDGLALRSGPGTQYSVLQRVNRGTPLDVTCQVQNGTDVNGNRTWDKLTGGQWVSDYWTDSPSFNSYAPGLGDCNASPPPPSSTSVGESAARWAEARIGQTMTSENPNSDHWSGWCETFVEQAFGRRFRYGSADEQYRARSGAGQIHGGEPPRGAIVFYGPNHVAVGVGGGQIVGTVGQDSDRLPVQKTSYTYFANYRGWSMPY